MSALSVLGTSSSAGKSLIATALVRWFARRGVAVAPFKAHTMSNNARVVAEGEIGVAQYLQARAAGIPPDVRMNPVLIKPEGDDRSQVIVNGRVDERLSAAPWTARTPVLAEAVRCALRSLLAGFDLIVIEGAGSAAEVNLRDHDLSNLHAATLAGSRALLVTDIDRGGAFAHLYGTWALLGPAERDLISGFVLNRFRGDPALLSPGPERLEALTRVPTIGVVPMLRHDLPDEDGGSFPDHGSYELGTVGVVRYPTASNLDEFRLLTQVARVRWLERAAAAEDVDLLVLPGSKHVGTDLAWLRDGGWPSALRRRVDAGGLTLGICGGAQILGRRLVDPDGIDVADDGLGLLPIVTTFRRDKLVRPARVRFRRPPGVWSTLAEMHVDLYEIRHGRLTVEDPAAVVDDDDLAVADGPVLAISGHGLLEDPEVLRRLFGRRPKRSLEDTFEQLADAVDEHLDTAVVLEAARIR